MKITLELQSKIEQLLLEVGHNWDWSSIQLENNWKELYAELFWLKNGLQRKGMWNSEGFRDVIEEN